MPSQIDFHTEVATAQSSRVLDGDKVCPGCYVKGSKNIDSSA